MANNIAKVDILQIFGLVISIGKSAHYSISFDYDTEFNECDLHLWYSANAESIDFAYHVSSRDYSFKDIIKHLKEWTRLIVEDRGGPIDNHH